MNLILQLPEVLVGSILIDWLSLRDFARLDSALGDKKSRAELHQSIKASRRTFSAEWVDYGNPKAQWLITRGVRCGTVRLCQELMMNTALREQFLIHSGCELQSLHLTLTNKKEKDIVTSILCGLTTNCPGLKKISISKDSDIYVILSSYDFTAFHTFILNHPSLESLILYDVKCVPLSFVLMALSQLTFVSFADCTVANDVEFTTLPPCTASFTCESTPLPPELCAHVTDLTTGCLQTQGTLNSYASCSNLSRAKLYAYDTPIDAHIAQQICHHWNKLMELSFHSQVIDEEIVLKFIKQLPNLQVLDTVGGSVFEVPVLPKLSSAAPSAVSRLFALRMHCNRTSTLERVLQLCPQLTKLSLEQPKRTENTVSTYVPVEMSLHLLRNISLRALYLAEYRDLCSKDLVALHHTDLHTLSIVEAGVNLNDKAILALVPTLRSLTTLNISYCKRLSYKLVLQVPPLCPSLRSYTYYKSPNGCSGGDSDSFFVLNELLPKFFPHIKEFSIHC